MNVEGDELLAQFGPLRAALMRADLAAVRRCVEDGFDLNARGESGEPFLH